jgi:hypothetical protein
MIPGCDQRGIVPPLTQTLSPRQAGGEGIKDKNTLLRGGDEAIEIDEIAVWVPKVGGAVAPGEGCGGQDEVDFETDTMQALIFLIDISHLKLQHHAAGAGFGHVSRGNLGKTRFFVE